MDLQTSLLLLMPSPSLKVRFDNMASTPSLQSSPEPSYATYVAWFKDGGFKPQTPTLPSVSRNETRM